MVFHSAEGQTLTRANGNSPPRTGRKQPATYPDTKVGKDNYVDFDTVTSSAQPGPNQEVQYSDGDLLFYDESQSKDVRQLFQDTQVAVVADAKANLAGCRTATNYTTDGSLDLSSDVTAKESVCISTSDHAWAVLKVRSSEGPAIVDIWVYEP